MTPAKAQRKDPSMERHPRLRDRQKGGPAALTGAVGRRTVPLASLASAISGKVRPPTATATCRSVHMIANLLTSEGSKRTRSSTASSNAVTQGRTYAYRFRLMRASETEPSNDSDGI